MSNPLGGRCQDKLMAICMFPSINYTPVKPGIPIPYPVWRMMGNSQNTTPTVHFNGEECYALDTTIQPDCIGDFIGQGGGVKSGTVSDEVKPKKGSDSIYVEGQRLIRKGDPCTLNDGNTFGKYTALGNVLSGLAHFALGALSFLPPPFGTIAAGADALLYAFEGDYASAAMSAAGMIPGAKYAQAIGKVGNIASKIGSKLSPLTQAIGKVAGKFKPGGALIKGKPLKCGKCVLGSVVSMGMGAHELISMATGALNYASDVMSFFGSPVHALRGAKVLMGDEDLDYQGDGYLPFYLQRLYNSQNPHVG